MDKIQRKIRRKWWFIVPVIILAGVSTLCLCWALGFPNPFIPFSIAHLIVFMILLDSFQRFYSWVLWWTLVWIAPARVGEKSLNS
jgi:hypothetical protein